MSDDTVFDRCPELQLPSPRRCRRPQPPRARQDARRPATRPREVLIAGDREFRTGDRVVCLRNQRADDLLNGLRGVVISIDADARSLTVRLTDGTDRVIPTSYLDAGHLDHGYAMTIHKAQGLTADEALLLATDDLYREAEYTALSRARFDTRAYVVADDFSDDPRIDLSHASESQSLSG